MILQRGLAVIIVIIMVGGLVAQAHENAGVLERSDEVAQAVQIFISVPLRGASQDKKEAEKEEEDEGDDNDQDQGLGDNHVVARSGSVSALSVSALCAAIEKDSEYKKIAKRAGSLMFKTSQVVGALILMGNSVWAHSMIQAQQAVQDKNTAAQANQVNFALLMAQLMRVAAIPSALVLLNNAFGASN
jgi:hypothetical protein